MLNSLDVYNTVSQETRFTCPWTRARLKDNERSTCSIVSAMEWILVFRLMAALGKYAFRIQNACLFVDCSIENVINSIYWRSGE